MSRSRPPTPPAWSRIPAPSIGSCNTATTSSRIITLRHSGSPIGTSSGDPRSRPNTASASTPGGSIPRPNRQPKRRRARCRRDVACNVIPAKAGIHLSDSRTAEGWVPAFAGTTTLSRRAAPMIAYAIRRIMLMVPTLFAIMVVNFFIVQAAPGGPIQQMISKLKGTQVSATERVSSSGNELKSQSGGESQYRGARGLDPAFIKELEKQYGFDKPPVERSVLVMKNYLTFVFGT